MKRMVLLLCSLSFLNCAHAQLTLTGTSYTQNFNSLSPSAGIPAGWHLLTGATSTGLGTDVTSGSYNAIPVKWTTTRGEYRNVASANGTAYFGSFGSDSLAQATTADRALAVRQVSSTSSTFPNSDPGAAFALQITNTNGLSNFSLSFKLQSLDSTSPRATAWSVDYGFGASPSSFTTATTVGNVTTGGNTYSNNTVTVNFGSALNNQTSVWIRIVTLSATTGSSNRTTTGIDDFALTWSGSSAPSYHPVLLSTAPANNATGVPLSSNLQMVFDRNVQKTSTGSVYIKNETDNTLQAKAVTSSDISVSGKTVTVANVTLLTGKTYHVTFDSTAFDTAGYKCGGLYDSTLWKFSTSLGTLTSLTEDFNTACATSQLPAGWSKYSVTGSQVWNCTTYGYSNTSAMEMNGYSGGNQVNEDWLITPRLDLSAMTAAAVQFRAYKKFAGDDLKIMVSANYTGTGDPNAATWSDLNVNFSTVDTNFNQFTGILTAYKATPMYIGFKYTSDASASARWRIDNVSVVVPSDVNQVNGSGSSSLRVLGLADRNNMLLDLNVHDAGMCKVLIYDMTGRCLYTQNIYAHAGSQRIDLSGLSLGSGMHIVKVIGDNVYGVTKTTVE